MTSIDTSTDAVEARCQHLDHVAHDRKSADAALMRALAAERDAAHAAGRNEALEEAIAVCERGEILTAGSAAAHLRQRRALQHQKDTDPRWAAVMAISAIAAAVAKNHEDQS